MPNQEMLIDPWSWYDFKPVFDHDNRSLWRAPSWIGEHFRRLQAYKLLESYYRNNASDWLDSTVSEEDRSSRREYGDPQTIVNTMKSSIIGDRQTLMVGDTEEEQNSDDAKKQLKILLQWMKDENFKLKFLESELASVKLGDSVYVLGWDPDVGRPRMNVWDPGFYFPVMDPALPTDEFPRKIHIAYQYEIEDDTGKKVYVRRITWELKDQDKAEKLPWNDKPTTLRCFMTDATWLIDDQKNNVDDFTMEKAMFETYVDPDTEEEFDWDDINIGLDFIPVIHMPNTPATQEHFGTSTMGAVLQIFDDLSNTDTDLQASSATTGSPPIALNGSSAPKDENGQIKSYGPGTVFETGDGTATMIDTSRSLDALLKYDDHLLERLSVNGRIPESILGRVKPSEVPSGITLALSFAPHTAAVGEARQVRDQKYPIFFKFVCRMFQLWGKGDQSIKKTFETKLVMGSFLPSNKSETVTMVQELRTTTPLPSISIETAIRMLMEAGFPIEDAAKEVERIQNQDFEGAGKLLDATANTEAVGKYLGVKAEAPVPPPAPPPDPNNPPPPPPPGQ